MDFGGKCSFANMMKSGSGNPQEVDHALLGEFMIQEDVEMYIQSPGYDDLRGFDPSNAMELSATSKEFSGSAKHSRLNLKRRLFNMRP